MPPQKYASTDPNFGKEPSPPSAPVAEPSSGDNLKDFGAGVLKGAGRNYLDLAKLAVKINPARLMTLPFEPFLPEQFRPGYTPPQVDAMLKPTNKPQEYGAFTGAIASSAIPGAGAAPFAERAANSMMRYAAAEDSPAIAAKLLEMGAKGTRSSAARIAQQRAAAVPPGLKVTTDKVSEAAARLADRSKSGASLFSPPTKPMIATGMSNILNDLAPVIDAGTYGAGGAFARILSGLLGGGQQ